MKRLFDFFIKPFRQLKTTLELNDVFVLGGIGLVVFGIWQIYRPAAFIAAGLGFMWLGWPAVRRSKQ